MLHLVNESHRPEVNSHPCSHPSISIQGISCRAAEAEDLIVMPRRLQRRTKLIRYSFKTGHSRNIFGVSFLPESDDSRIVTGAMDSEVRLHTTTECGETMTRLYTPHSDRVKVEKAPPHPSPQRLASRTRHSLHRPLQPMLPEFRD
jgi:WD40 repeat protein